MGKNRGFYAEGAVTQRFTEIHGEKDGRVLSTTLVIFSDTIQIRYRYAVR
jgi:hypothetical protein